MGISLCCVIIICSCFFSTPNPSLRQAANQIVNNDWYKEEEVLAHGSVIDHTGSPETLAVVPEASLSQTYGFWDWT